MPSALKVSASVLARKGHAKRRRSDAEAYDAHPEEEAMLLGEEQEDGEYGQHMDQDEHDGLLDAVSQVGSLLS